MNPKMEKAPEKVAPISVPLLHDYQNSAEMKKERNLSTYSFSRMASETALLPVLKKKRDQKMFLKACIRRGVYLFWEPQNIPTRNSSVVFYNNLQVLELADGDGVEGDVEENEAPLEEGVDGVGCINIGFCSRKGWTQAYLQRHDEPCVE
jgi:hypothetical protein